MKYDVCRQNNFLMEPSDSASDEKKKADRAFLHAWGYFFGGCLYEIRSLTLNFLFIRELHPLKYVPNTAALYLDVESLLKNTTNPIVKELYCLLNTGLAILIQFSDLNKLNFSEFFSERRAFGGFNRPGNWKRPPKDEAEYHLYVPDLLFAFLVYCSDTLFEKSRSYMNNVEAKEINFDLGNLPTDKSCQNTAIIIEVVCIFSETVLKIEKLRSQERN